VGTPVGLIVTTVGMALVGRTVVTILTTDDTTAVGTDVTNETTPEGTPIETPILVGTTLTAEVTMLVGSAIVVSLLVMTLITDDTPTETATLVGTMLTTDVTIPVGRAVVVMILVVSTFVTPTEVLTLVTPPSTEVTTGTTPPRPPSCRRACWLQTKPAVLSLCLSIEMAVRAFRSKGYTAAASVGDWVTIDWIVVLRWVKERLIWDMIAQRDRCSFRTASARLPSSGTGTALAAAVTALMADTIFGTASE